MDKPMIYDFMRLEPGELYLFFPAGGASQGLWGVFERRDSRCGVVLSVCSGDLRRYDLWASLPSGYVCCRLASQEEARRFSLGLGRRLNAR